MSPARLPEIVLCAPEHADVLTSEFARYTRDYTVRACASAAETSDALRSLVAEGVRIPLLVTESALPDSEIFPAIAQWRSIVPTSRRVVVAHWSRFLTDAPALRRGMATGKYDAYLLMPRGARDEEFHTAITELLSDWGSTVADPEVPSAKIVTEGNDPLVVAIRDFLDRMGMPSHTYFPRSEVGTRILDRLAEDVDPSEIRLPVVTAMSRPPAMAGSVRDVAAAIYGNPGDIDVDTVADLVVVGAGPAGLAAAVYGSSEGLTTVVIESEAIGGQAGTSSMIRNYLGFPRGISGMRLAQRARSQAIRFGTRFFTGWPVTALVPGGDGEPHRVVTEGGEVRARAVVIASGVAYRRLRVDAVEELVGRGVHYGAAVSAAREMEGRDVVRRRRRQLRGPGRDPPGPLRPLGDDPGPAARPGRDDVGLPDPRDLLQPGDLRAPLRRGGRRRRRRPARVARLRDLETGRGSRCEADGLFLLLGAEPHCDWLPATVVPRRAWLRAHRP